MKSLWVDANVLIRFITRDPQDMATRAYQLMARAAEGELTLLLSALTLAEVVWTLESFYGFNRREVAGHLMSLVVADGVEAPEADVLLPALQLYHDKNVDFADAYLAARAKRGGNPHVASFDRDFDRLGVQRHEPPHVPGDEGLQGP